MWGWNGDRGEKGEQDRARGSSPPTPLVILPPSVPTITTEIRRKVSYWIDTEALQASTVILITESTLQLHPTTKQTFIKYRHIRL